ncbi:hypothetical protein BU15DRAFT_78636 [Melanogaster broomeanus]|nr:hypothetical protein BU15DRAFT_78636 [Melanogaster broomeanus]
MDLANLKASKQLPRNSSGNTLNVLFNNAGVDGSSDGSAHDASYDLQFGTNVLGHFYFTKLVLLSFSPPRNRHQHGIARVANTLAMVIGWEAQF